MYVVASGLQHRCPDNASVGPDRLIGGPPTLDREACRERVISPPELGSAGAGVRSIPRVAIRAFIEAGPRCVGHSGSERDPTCIAIAHVTMLLRRVRARWMESSSEPTS